MKKSLYTVPRLRLLSQIFMVLMCLWIGIEFFLFVRFLESGGQTTFVARPPGAEAFLPISSMMSLRYTVDTGAVHPYHPAGLMIFVAILAMSFVFGKSFCGWICPFGFLSEMLEKLTKKTILGKIRIPKWIDYPLRSLKYVLLGFFFWATFAVPLAGIAMFLDSSYNLMADVKMYEFFANISKTALIVILVLLGLSVLIPRFWCRYLCPYGGLLGILGLMSPNKIKRNTESCIDCGKCAKVCPSRIKVDKVKVVVSDECLSCLECVAACPVKDTLEMHNLQVKRAIPKWWVAAGVLVVFFAILGGAKLAGHWHNTVRVEEYQFHYQMLDQLGHPRSAKDMRELGQ